MTSVGEAVINPRLAELGHQMVCIISYVLKGPVHQFLTELKWFQSTHTVSGLRFLPLKPYRPGGLLSFEFIKPSPLTAPLTILCSSYCQR